MINFEEEKIDLRIFNGMFFMMNSTLGTVGKDIDEARHGCSVRGDFTGAMISTNRVLSSCVHVPDIEYALDD